jgi:hypothetical protein
VVSDLKISATLWKVLWDGTARRGTRLSNHPGWAQIRARDVRMRLTRTSRIVAKETVRCGTHPWVPAENFLEHATMAQVSTQISNKAIVQESFNRWKNGNGSPFELLVPEAEWTIVGSSPLFKTYYSPKGIPRRGGQPV